MSLVYAKTIRLLLWELVDTELGPITISNSSDLFRGKSVGGPELIVSRPLSMIGYADE